MQYIESVKKEGKSPVILDAGDALFESSNTIMKQNLASSKFKAQSLVKGYEVIGYEAINVGAFDLAAGYEFLKTVSDGTTASQCNSYLGIEVAKILPSAE